MPSVQDSRLLTEMSALGQQLAAALKAQDWDAVGGIDLSIRGCLQTLAQMETVSPELQEVKNQLQQLYQRVIPAYSEACEKLRVLLLNHIDHAEGRSAYMRTELLQGEG
ncbi:hypothetical protein [Cellvibrio sp. NN19]|uniref:hypothetical protein n=1 Tax=Cellvibrio chitinivorans TaxID=3102792 RepID=UPI002B4159F7|nr:hypothetical protein [Cellvibrio sp. NN19]